MSRDGQAITAALGLVTGAAALAWTLSSRARMPGWMFTTSVTVNSLAALAWLVALVVVALGDD